jgi:hypothetical protein
MTLDESISNELSSSTIQDQTNDIEALNERIRNLESENLQLNQDLIFYKKSTISSSVR